MIKLLIFLFTSVITTGVTAKSIDKLIPLEHTKIYGLSMNQSDLKDVFSLFGKTKAWKRKDQHHDSFFYCYKLNSTPTSVWIIMGLGWTTNFKKVDSIRVTTSKKDILGTCMPSDISAKKISTQSNIRIGLTETEALKLIRDEPTKINKKPSYTYLYEWYEKYTEPKTRPSNDFLYIGEWHYGRITYDIINDILTSFYISVGSEPEWVTKEEKIEETK